MLHYREIPPSAEWAASIECFWTMDAPGGAPLHRVLPDGCADILLTERKGAVQAEVVGPMTAYRDHEVAAGLRMLGVRFRPGRWTGALGIPGNRIVDAVVPLEDLWGSRRAREFRERGLDARAIESLLPKPSPETPVERAVAFLGEAGGCAGVEHLADQAGLSIRQFRRVCLEKTGLTPKLLARVLRFRNAAARVRAAQSAAALALDCGYYDQAHLIRDFREFSGKTPAAQRPGHSSDA